MEGPELIIISVLLVCIVTIIALLALYFFRNKLRLLSLNFRRTSSTSPRFHPVSVDLTLNNQTNFATISSFDVSRSYNGSTNTGVSLNDLSVNNNTNLTLVNKRLKLNQYILTYPAIDIHQFSVMYPDHPVSVALTSTPFHSSKVRPRDTSSLQFSSSSLGRKNNGVIYQLDSEKIEIFNVVSPYLSCRDDEVGVVKGDKVMLKKVFSDGWCEGVRIPCANIKKDGYAGEMGTIGIFPITCIVGLGEAEDDIAESANQPLLSNPAQTPKLSNINATTTLMNPNSSPKMDYARRGSVASQSINHLGEFPRKNSNAAQSMNFSGNYSQINSSAVDVDLSATFNVLSNVSTPSSHSSSPIRSTSVSPVSGTTSPYYSPGRRPTMLNSQTSPATIYKQPESIPVRNTSYSISNNYPGRTAPILTNATILHQHQPQHQVQPIPPSMIHNMPVQPLPELPPSEQHQQPNFSPIPSLASSGAESYFSTTPPSHSYIKTLESFPELAEGSSIHATTSQRSSMQYLSSDDQLAGGTITTLSLSDRSPMSSLDGTNRSGSRVSRQQQKNAKAFVNEITNQSVGNNRASMMTTSTGEMWDEVKSEGTVKNGNNQRSVNTDASHRRSILTELSSKPSSDGILSSADSHRSHKLDTYKSTLERRSVSVKKFEPEASQFSAPRKKSIDRSFQDSSSINFDDDRSGDELTKPIRPKSVHKKPSQWLTDGSPPDPQGIMRKNLSEISLA
ncbi:hypothetical protein HK098_000492 [Nowakowskiella sp. JEL0407]|nr:hypothetical protein HK098_000492 [Nowakowskiella sp. JEL0407]